VLQAVYLVAVVARLSALEFLMLAASLSKSLAPLVAIHFLAP
jgi:hypothetical protein